MLTGFMFGALGLLLSSVVKQLENFAGVMNFVIFPMFFRLRRSIRCGACRSRACRYTEVCQFNPFTHAVELIRFALYGQINWLALAVVSGCLVVFFGLAVVAYNPSKGMMVRRAAV